MNIIAVSYYNIWPFFEQIISVIFKKWKYLINSSVGSGKSFLFFDSPLFALYKYSNRPILNKKSQKWFVKILFEIDWSLYFIHRIIKVTKSGWESVSSSLFCYQKNIDLVIQDIENNYNEIINYWVDFSDILSNFDFEQIQFKLEQELQKTLESLIVPRQVFLNTNFLMQEWDNIFDLTPIERINVFKNIFNLLWIDEAKEIVWTEKREIQLKLKIKKDTSHFDNKIRKYINLFLEHFNDEFKKQLCSENLQIISDLDFIKDKISIFDFDYKSIDINQISNIEKDLIEKKEYYQSLLANIKTYKSTINLLQNDYNNIIQNIENNENQIKKLKKKINSFDFSKIDKMIEEKQNLFKEQKNILQNIDFDIYAKYNYEINDIFQANNLLVELSYKWKDYRQNKKNYENDLEKLEIKYKELNDKLNDLEIKEGSRYYEIFKSKQKDLINDLNIKKNNIEFEIKSLWEKEKNLQDKLQDINLRLKSIWENIDNEMTFFCNKIEANCPYIDNIKKDTLLSKEKEQSQIQLQKNNIEEKIKNLDFESKIKDKNNELQKINYQIKDINDWKKEYFIDIFEKQEELIKNINNEIKNLDYENKKYKLQDQINQIDKKINKLAWFFNEIKWSIFKENYEKYIDIDNQIRKLDSQIFEIQKEQKSIQDSKEKIISIESTIHSLQEQKESISKKIQENTKSLEKLESKLWSLWYSKIEKQEKDLQQIKLYRWYIYDLLEDFKKEQIQINKLKYDEKILWDLYNIFSKEIMLIVLEDFLPQIEDIMNNYLSQVVDYQIKFQLERKSKEKLELEINILDNLWNRPVKSLSGWQRTILKLVWIMSIASLLRTKFLFLDETINNLDFESIGRVSSLLEDFVRSTDIKFYVVTHSKQIQQMDIWDANIAV